MVDKSSKMLEKNNKDIFSKLDMKAGQNGHGDIRETLMDTYVWITEAVLKYLQTTHCEGLWDL